MVEIVSLRARIITWFVRRNTARFDRGEPSLAMRRERMEGLSSIAKPPRGVTFEPTRAGPVPAEWVVPPEPTSPAVVLYLHGGAYTQGSIASHRGIIAHVANRTGVRLLLIAYRLAPEHPHPAALDDAVAVYRWLLAAGHAPSNIVIAGDSAGGGLTLATLLALSDRGEPLPAGAVCISPWTDLAVTGASVRSKADIDPMLSADQLATAAAAYCGDENADPRDPSISPLYGDLAGLPPILIQVGSAEILLDDATRFAKRATSARVDVELEVWEGMFHCWHLFTRFVPESRRAIDAVGAFITSRVGSYG